MTSISNRFFAVKEEVAEALKAGRPVVALESTLISHGLPWPENKSVGLEIEVFIKIRSYFYYFKVPFELAKFCPY